MKITSILVFIFLLSFFPYCKKNRSDPNPPKLQKAVFSDLVNGKKIEGLTINLFETRVTGGLLGVLEDIITAQKTTDSDGKIEFQDNAFSGFDCTADGFFPFHYNSVGLIDYDGLTYNVKLLPKAYVNLHLAPSTPYPANYKFSLNWICRDSNQIINTYGLINIPSYFNPVDSLFTITVGGDINNQLTWQLLDSNYNFVAADSIKNIIVPRSDTTNIEIAF